MKKKLLILIIILFYSLFLAAIVAGLGIASPYYENNKIFMNPGESKIYEINIQNSDDFDILIEVHIDSDIVRVMDYQEKYLIKGKSYDTKIDFQINVPQNAIAGTVYPVKFYVQPVEIEGTIPVKFRINKEFYVEISGNQDNSEISNNSKTNSPTNSPAQKSKEENVPESVPIQGEVVKETSSENKNSGTNLKNNANTLASNNEEIKKTPAGTTDTASNIIKEFIKKDERENNIVNLFIIVILALFILTMVLNYGKKRIKKREEASE